MFFKNTQQPDPAVPKCFFTKPSLPAVSRKEETPHHHVPNVGSERNAAENGVTANVLHRDAGTSARSPRHTRAGDPRKPGHGHVITFRTGETSRREAAAKNVRLLAFPQYLHKTAFLMDACGLLSAQGQRKRPTLSRSPNNWLTHSSEFPSRPRHEPVPSLCHLCIHKRCR